MKSGFHLCSSSQNLRSGSINFHKLVRQVDFDEIAPHDIVAFGLVFVVAVYAPQTKILEVLTNVSECFFEALFNDS